MTDDGKVRQFRGGAKYDRPRKPPTETFKGGMAPDAFANNGKRKANGPDPQQTTKTLHANKPTSYEVGYAKPPKGRQYRPGQSGNPYGRPLGAKNKPKIDQEALSLRAIILDQANREIAIQEGGKTKKIPAKEVIIRATIASAAKGDPRSQKLALDLVQKAEASKDNERRVLYEAAVDYKLAWERKLEAYREKGLDKLDHEPARPFPDPDHIIIDPIAGTVGICGPLSRDEIPKYQFLWNEKEKAFKKIEDIIEKLNQCSDRVERKKLSKQFDKAVVEIGKLNFLLGNWTPSSDAQKNKK